MNNGEQYQNLSYINNPGKSPLLPATVGTLLDTAARAYGNSRLAAIFCEENLRATFDDVLEQADKFAAGLLALGLKAKDKVGIWGPNLYQWYISYLACARANLVAVCLNTSNEICDMEYIMNLVEMKCLICPISYKNRQFYRILCNAIPELEFSESPHLKSTKYPDLKHVILMANQHISNSTYTFEQVLNFANDKLIQHVKQNQRNISMESISNIVFSSGTTGRPKAVLQTYFQIANEAHDIAKCLELNSKHQFVCAQVPLFHVFGTVVAITASFIYGTTLVIPAPTYSSEDNYKAIVNEKCTIVYGTPTMYIDLLTVHEKLSKKIIHLETILTGAAPISAEVVKRLKKHFLVKRIKSIYGASECTAGIFLSHPKDQSDETACETVGYLMEHMEAKVVDEENRIVPFGKRGELLVRGYNTTKGYYQDPENTKRLYAENNWLRTGDQFVIFPNGSGQIVGRIKDLIIRGGENISPKEIEDYLSTHPDILQVQVIGIPHERLGEEVCACVKLKENRSLNLETLQKFCKNKIAYFKSPAQLKIVEQFPMTASGKIQKHKLRELYSNRQANLVEFKNNIQQTFL